MLRNASEEDKPSAPHPQLKTGPRRGLETQEDTLKTASAVASEVRPVSPRAQREASRASFSPARPLGRSQMASEPRPQPSASGHSPGPGRAPRMGQPEPTRPGPAVAEAKPSAAYAWCVPPRGPYLSRLPSPSWFLNTSTIFSFCGSLTSSRKRFRRRFAYKLRC